MRRAAGSAQLWHIENITARKFTQNVISIEIMRNGEISMIIEKPKTVGYLVSRSSARANEAGGYGILLKAFYKAHEYACFGNIDVYANTGRLWIYNKLVWFQKYFSGNH